MPDGKPSATILDFQAWREVLRDAKPPEESGMMMAAAENARTVARLAERNRDALDRLSAMPSDSEGA